MTNVRNAYAYLKHMNLGANAAQVPHLSSISMRIGDDVIPARVFSHEAAVMYTVDEGTRFSFVSESDMQAAGIDAEQLHAIGVGNLQQVLSTMTITEANGAMIFSGSGNFEASMLLVPPLWESHLAPHFPNGAIASIAARDILAVCDRSNTDMIATLRSSSNTLWSQNADHLLARDLYARTAEGTWVPFVENAPPAAPQPPAASQPQMPPAPAAPQPPVPPAPSAPPTVPTQTATGELDPKTRTADVGLDETIISNSLLGGDVLSSEQIQKMYDSGYRWNPDSQSFHRVFVGEPGAPSMPWEQADWGGKSAKRGLFGRKR